MSAEPDSLAIIRGILEDLPMSRWQDPQIETKKGVPRPYYFIRPYVADFSTGSFEKRRKLLRLGYCDETNMRKAQSRKQEIMSEINKGQIIYSGQIKFKDLVAKYKESRLPKLGFATQNKYRTHIDNHILPTFADAELLDIDRQAVEAWLAREASEHTHPVDGQNKNFIGLGWWSLADLRNILSAIFTAAKDWKLWQGENPCEGVSLGEKSEKRVKKIPKAASLQGFLAALPDTVIIPAAGARLIVLTALVSGLRVSEVLGLQVGDVSAAQGTLQVARRAHRGDVGKTKSRSSRRVRQVGPVAQQLVDYAIGKLDEDWIFDREGETLDDRSLQQHVFRPAAEAVGMYFEGFGLHTFRRLNITWRQQEGATPAEAQKAAGHASYSTTYEYTIVDEDRELAHVTGILNRILPDMKGPAN